MFLHNYIIIIIISYDLFLVRTPNLFIFLSDFIYQYMELIVFCLWKMSGNLSKT